MAKLIIIRGNRTEMISAKKQCADGGEKKTI